MQTSLITQEFIQFARGHFELDWAGIHGAAHWARVRRNGLESAASEGANPKVIEYFAFTHDLCRHDDFMDAGHGRRAAKLARKLNGRLIHLDDSELELLTEACSHHSKGFIKADITVQCCWDADRLDLTRLGIAIDSKRLCTHTAKTMISTERHHKDFLC